MAEQPVLQRAVEPQSLPSERQVGGTVLRTGGASSGGHHLEAAVEQERVHHRAAAVHAVGQGHLAQRLAVANRQRVQRAERFAEVHSRIGPGPVELRDVDRGEIGPELLQFERLGTGRWAGTGRHLTLGVQSPSVFAVGAAERLESAWRRPVGAVEHELHAAPGGLGGVLRVVLFEDHRAVELKVLHDQRP